MPKRIQRKGKQPIVSVSNDTWQNARRGVWSCPFCDFDARDDMEVWDRQATRLILEPKVWKPGCLAFFSECPQCFEESWVHVELRSFLVLHQTFPADWRRKGKALYRQAMADAQKELEASLCFRCVHNEKLYIDYCYPISKCKDGEWTHNGHAETECDHFQER